MSENFSNDIKNQVESLLRMIEVTHQIKIVNLGEISSLITQNVDNKNDALKVCTAINTWITVNKIQTSIIIPENLVIKYINAIRRI
jgi:predicted DNA-binding protein (UPF0278 family)